MFNSVKTFILVAVVTLFVASCGCMNAGSSPKCSNCAEKCQCVDCKCESKADCKCAKCDCAKCDCKNSKCKKCEPKSGEKPCTKCPPKK